MRLALPALTPRVDLGGVIASYGSLLWEDDFNGPAGSPPDPASWTREIGHAFGASELQEYTALASNASQDGAGNLAITARRETTPDGTVPTADMGDRAYTSARLVTKGKRFWPVPVRICGRFHVPWTRGLWPAFWLMGEGSTAYPTWPEFGEVDVFESGLGARPAASSHTHYGATGTFAHLQRDGRDLPVEFSPPRWTVYGVDLYPDRLDYWLDGHLHTRHTRAFIEGNGGDWTPFLPGSQPGFHMLLNVAVGGGGTPPPTAGSVFPQTMLVDWVRAYSL